MANKSGKRSLSKPKSREVRAFKAAKPKPLRWRVSRIRDWRKSRDEMSLEELAERLARLDPPIRTTYASLGRIERGLQKPDILMIEGIAKVLNTDIDSLLNHSPTNAGERVLEIVRNAIKHTT